MSKTIREEEREQFDSKVSRLYNGDALAAVAEALRISSDVFPPQGSFSNLLAIFAEEVEKARVKLASFPSPDYQRGQEDEKEGAMAFACYLLDNHEREEITEERLQQWCSDFIRALPAQQESVDLATIAPVTTFAEYAKSKESVCEWRGPYLSGSREAYSLGCRSGEMIVAAGQTECPMCSRPIRLGGWDED